MKIPDAPKPRGGSKPGERRGGRRKGSLNFATRERLAREKMAEELAVQIGAPESATAIALHKAMEGRKLAKDDVADVVPIIKGIVEHYQRKSTAIHKKTGLLFVKGDPSDLKEWLQLLVNTLFKLAEFQSAKPRVLMVSAYDEQQSMKTIDADNVIPLNDAVGASRVYRRIMSAGTRR